MVWRISLNYSLTEGGKGYDRAAILGNLFLENQTLVQFRNGFPIRAELIILDR